MSPARFLPAVLALLATVLNGQPRGQVLWSHPGTDGIYSTVALTDANGDSVPDVVGAIYYGSYPSDPRKVYCLSGRTGDSLWIADTSSAYGTWGNKGLDACPDLDGDGVEDVLLGTVGTYLPPGRSCIAISGADGDSLWTFPFGQERGWCYSVRAFLAPDRTPVDVDGDGVVEVLAGAGGVTNDRRGTAICLSGSNGDSIWAFRPDGDGVQCLAPFVDLGGDTIPEVLVGAGGNGSDNRAFCLSGRNGSVVWQCTTGNSVSDIERIPDVNNSGVDDVVCGGWAYKVYCLEGSTGDSIWVTSLGSGNIVMELVPVRDTDGDGIGDVVVGSWDDRVYVLSGADGSTLWTGAVGNDVWAIDTLADVDGDSLPEVVAGCLGDGNGVVRVFSGADGNVLWYYDFNERVYDVTGIPDVNADGRADVAVGLQDHGHMADHFYCFSGSPGSGIAAGNAPPARRLLSPVFGGRVAIRLEPGTRYRLDFIDAAGRSIGHAGGTAGTDDDIFDGGRLGAGAWFCRLTTEDARTETAKLVVPRELSH
ncbi:PQQ-like beta-propeller repeat protein [candidate division WOR-3 bacterium]|nr:PQQ-like beta-propeller repeat protein [candidate division WOR-3 bacterium]